MVAIECLDLTSKTEDIDTHHDDKNRRDQYREEDDFDHFSAFSRFPRAAAIS